MEIRFIKPSFKYLSGQWLWLNIPSLSSLQWHPFTITSSPSDEYISVHIRCVGDWTNDLATQVGITSRIEDESTTTSSSISLPGLLKIHVDGPFGAPAELVYRQNAAICVGSGIGITPWASVLKDIWSVLFLGGTDCQGTKEKWGGESTAHEITCHLGLSKYQSITMVRTFTRRYTIRLVDF